MDIAGLLGLLGNAESEQYTSQAPVSGLLGEFAGGVGKRLKKGATNPMGLLGDLAASMQENMPLPSTENLRNGQFFVTGSDQDKWIDAAPGMAGIMAGVNSKTADLVKLARAKQLQAQGVPDEQIYAQTGWFNRMPDKKWRYEIDDSAAGIIPKTSKTKGYNIDYGVFEAPPAGRAWFGDVVDHGELKQAYPDISKITMDAPFGVAAKKAADGAYYAKQPFFPEKIDINSLIMSDKQKTLSAILHDTQHAVQQREGFSIGGNYFRMPKSEYRNTLGEAEARLVQSRMNMTPAQRAASYPPSMLDVPIDQLIVRY